MERARAGRSSLTPRIRSHREQRQSAPSRCTDLADRSKLWLRSRSRSFIVPPLGVNASILKRVGSRGPFGLFEGMEVDVHRRSAPLTVHARPLPPGPPVSAVGDALAMRCGMPLQRNGGPVAIDVAMSGRANLRAVSP